MTTEHESEAWSLVDVARAAGCSSSYVYARVRDLVPEHLVQVENKCRRRGVQIPDELAKALVSVFRAGICTSKLGELMQESPDQVMEAAEGLALLAMLSGAKGPSRKPASGQDAAASSGVAA